MDDIEVKLRLLEAAAKAYGGVSSMHSPSSVVAEIARNWYNSIESWKKPDTVKTSETLKLPSRK